MPSESNRARTPSPALGLIAIALAALIVLLVGFRPGLADGPSPAKKDSSPRTRPKDAVLTPSITPAEARPGDTVVYKITAKLNPDWHIYTYTREKGDQGPRRTRFDLFDTGGLTLAGDWTPVRPPLRKKEPAFPEIDALEYYEGEVSWSLSLKVPADATPGKKILRCQASYQICDSKRCSFPGAWTLPDVALTVINGDSNPATTAVTASQAQPKMPDGNARLKPKTVAFSASIKPETIKPGDTLTYSVTAKLEPGWHIYDYNPQNAAVGPQGTQFDLFETNGLKVAGDWTANTPPIVKQDEVFNMLVSTFEGEVTWSLPLKVPADLAPGKKSLRCQVSYSVCNATSCLPPFRESLSLVSVNVLPAVAGAVVADEPPKVAAAPAPAPAPALDPKAKEPAPKKAVSAVEQKARQGIIPLMIASALGGLLALVMPCVWPMVPITVNFFVKQGQSKKSKPTALAVTYCLAIIGVFTSVGVLCSFFVSATALPRLANNPWLNFAVAGLFFAFGLSLLGLFEISLPTSFLNASAKGESRGGLIGVMFMALTLTITSFTCTFPVVGGLLVMASTGEFFYPIIGLGTFSTVLALPFFLLALSPGLLSKMPKSGDWMNAVKVVGGLVEIGAAFKFLNTAELAFVTPENAWIDAQFVLTAWVVLAAICGFYLLGFFRTDHDHAEVKVGPGRMILGAVFLGFALFLAPALFGHPPQSQIWNRLVVGLLPPDVGELDQAPSGSIASNGNGRGESRGERATESDPAAAERQEKIFHGVEWGLSYEQAVERSKAEKKPILIDFTGVNCPNCRTMERNVLPRPDVTSLLGRFVTVQLYTDFVPINSITAEQREERAQKNQLLQMDLGRDNTNPFYVVIAPDGQVLGTTGFCEPESFVGFLNRSLAKLKGEGGQEVVQAEKSR